MNIEFEIEIYCLKIKLNAAALTLRAPARSLSDFPDSQRNLKYSDIHIRLKSIESKKLEVSTFK